MTQHWDDFSKLLADESLPRRETLRRPGFLFAGAYGGRDYADGHLACPLRRPALFNSSARRLPRMTLKIPSTTKGVLQ